MRADPVQAALVQLAGRALDAGGLRAGQVLNGMVDGTRPHLSVLVSGTHVALPETANLVSGQPVSIEVVETAQGLQLRISPRSDASGQGALAASATGSGAMPMAELTSRLLEALYGIRMPEGAERLIPPALPQNEAAVRIALAAFAGRTSLGQDLQLISDLVGQAAGPGGTLSEANQAALAALSQYVATDSEGLESLIRDLQVLAARPNEARIAAALAKGTGQAAGEGERGLREVLAGLRQDETLAGRLRGIGQLRAFQETADRVVDRLTGAQLQNLRGTDQAYYFIEVPFGPETGIRRAQVHFFGEGGGGRRGFDARNSMVAFDLSTTHLGDLWISLRAAHGFCECRLSATSPEAVRAIEDAAGELDSALREAGYERVNVKAALWTGDRLAEAAALMRRFSGINVQA